MSKAGALLERYYELSELHDSFIDKVSKESGVSVGEIKKAMKKFETALKRSIDPEASPGKFFGILTNLVKNQFGLAGASGGRTA